MSLPLGRGTTEALESAVEALSRANVDYLLAHPRTPMLHRSGVRYRREPRGRENWQSIPDMLRRGFGDCEDLAAWRIAEIRVHGGHAVPYILSKGNAYHVKVLRNDGISRVVEDPSRELGMR